MSKYVKNLLADEVKDRLSGVEDAIIVNVIGMDADATFRIRKHFREKGVSMLVVKRSVALRATGEDTIGGLFSEKRGPIAVVWGCEDFVSLAKEVAAVVKDEEGFPKFELKGGVMDGDSLSSEDVLAISKWPNREEQIAMLVGQILGPGSQLSSQLLGTGSTVAGQIKQLVENKEGEA